MAAGEGGALGNGLLAEFSWILLSHCRASLAQLNPAQLQEMRAITGKFTAFRDASNLLGLGALPEDSDAACCA